MEKFRISTGTQANWNSDVSFPLRQWNKPNERKQILCNLSNFGTWQEMSSKQF
jgi:hypothetical protein